MRSEPDLPPELADIETQLRQLSLPDTRINREQLFYQVGWAAARASVVPASSLLWPVTSGVLAAAVVVLAVLVARAPTTVQTVVEATVPALEQPAEQEIAKPRVEPFARRSLLPIRRWAETAPLLAMRERALRGEFPEPSLAVSLRTAPVPTTARELMREFLPEDERNELTSPATTPLWPWQRLFGRETI
jgi:hypothetical protein